MKSLRKILILILLILFISIPIKAWSMPETYEQGIFELRGSWVSTVSNIDISQQSTIEQYKKDYIKILNSFESFNMNAVFFQVRPTNDAFYVSEINPWSRFLIGVEGRDPGWDPLEWLIEVTHERGMEFHAWLNPYRASLDEISITVDDYLKNRTEEFYNQYLETEYASGLQGAFNKMSDMNFAKQHPEYLIPGGKRFLLNPGIPEVREHIYATITEIVENYDVDAIHFDDYFYNDVSFVSDRQLFLNDTQSSGYNLEAHKDWRRMQVDILIETIHNLIKDFNEENNRAIQFGISPAAGWAPAISSSCPASTRGMKDGMEGFPCNGYSSYHDLFADTRKWVKEEWLDYILPQNYFELGRYHELISDWWSSTVEGTNVRLYMGLGPFKFNDFDYLKKDEYINQLRFNSQFSNISGYVLFSARNLHSPNTQKLIESNNLIKTYWTRKPILPAFLTKDSDNLALASNIEAQRKNMLIEFSFTTNEDAAGYAIYRVLYNEAVDFSNENIYFLLPNDREQIFIKDNVENDKLYTYYIKNFTRTGNLASDQAVLDIKNVLINIAPVIDSFNTSIKTVYSPGDIINIDANISDANNDYLSVELSYTSDGKRYRYTYDLEVIAGKISFEMPIPNELSKNASFKLTISDGSKITEYLSKEFYVVSGQMGPLERQMYYVYNELNKQINDILGKGD